MNLFVLATLAALTSSAQIPSTDSLLRRHEEALRAIHSLRVEVTTRRSTDQGATWSPMSEIQATRSGQRDRSRIHLRGASFRGEWKPSESFRVVSSDPTEMRLVEGLEFRSRMPSTINPLDHPRVHAAISPPLPIGPHGRGSPLSDALLFTIETEGLRQLLGKSPSIPVVRGSDDFGPTWDLVTDRRGSGVRYTVSLSPAHHHAVSRVEADYQGHPAQGDPPFRASSEVISFHDDPAGFSIPTLIRSVSTHEPANQPTRTVLTESTIKIDSVNMAIPDEELALEFPPGMDVNDGVKLLFHVWGDGKPEKSFRSGPELMTWRRQAIAAIRQSRRDQSVFLSPAMLAFSTLTVLLASLVAWRRWSRPKKIA